MRRLADPDVLRSSGVAAVVTALLCYPRMVVWHGRSLPVWYLEATLFLGSFVLWAFIFAWHTKYTGRPVFTLKVKSGLFLATTAAGILAATGVHWFIDPVLRARMPDAYPQDAKEWVARALFNVSFLQVFLTFAPFAWLMRLSRNRSVAITLTVLFGVMVLVLNIRSMPTPLSSVLFLTAILFRIAAGLLTIGFYLQGGVLLASWWSLLIQLRLLFSLAPQATG